MLLSGFTDSSHLIHQTVYFFNGRLDIGLLGMHNLEAFMLISLTVDVLSGDEPLQTFSSQKTENTREIEKLSV